MTGLTADVTGGVAHRDPHLPHGVAHGAARLGESERDEEAGNASPHHDVALHAAQPSSLNSPVLRITGRPSVQPFSRT